MLLPPRNSKSVLLGQSETITLVVCHWRFLTVRGVGFAPTGNNAHEPLVISVWVSRQANRQDVRSVVDWPVEPQQGYVEPETKHTHVTQMQMMTKDYQS